MQNKYLLLVFYLFTFCCYAQLPKESFENSWAPATSGTSPTDWLVLQNNFGTNITWGQSIAGNSIQVPYNGQHAAFLNKDNAIGGIPADYLVTPEFPVPTNPELHFFSRLGFLGDQGSTYKVMVLPQGSDASNLLNYVEIQSWNELEINLNQTTYSEVIVSIPQQYIGQNIRIAFVMEANDGDRWLIDDVRVSEKCLNPTNGSAKNITLNTADLLWDDQNGGDTWEIEIILDSSTRTGQGIVYTGSLPYSIPLSAGLTLDTNYEYYIRSICDVTNGYKSDWVGPIYFTTGNYGDSCDYALPVASLPYFNANNTSNFADLYEGIPGAGCGVPTGVNYLAGNDVVYEYTPTVSGTINADLLYMLPGTGLFIYDSCDDIGVNCLAGGTSGLYEAIPISINDFPVTAGTTYYFVISDKNNTTTKYTLIIQEARCEEPAGLATTNIGTTTADLSWTNPTNATSWEVTVQPVGTGVPIVAGTTVTTNTNLTWGDTLGAGTLFPSTAYEYYVRSLCDDGTFSTWAGPYTFATKDCAVEDQCTYTFEMTSDILTGFWLDSSITVSQNGIELATFMGPIGGIYEPVTATLQVCKGVPVEIYLNEGSLSYVVALTVKNSYQQVIYVKELGVGEAGTVLFNEAVDCTQLCIPPIGLKTDNEGQNTAELSWDANPTGKWEYYAVEAGQPAPTAGSVGTITTTNPAVAEGLDPATVYEYYVRLICDEDTNTVSDWSTPFSFSTGICEASEKCDYTFVMTSEVSFGGLENSFTITQNGVTVKEIGPTFFNGASKTYTVALCPDSPFEVNWTNGGLLASWTGLTITSPFDQLLYSLPYGSDSLVGTIVYEGIVDCENPTCAAPMILTANNILSTTVDLSWDGPLTGTWEYYIVEEGADEPTETTLGTHTTTNPTVGVIIEPSKNYKFYVRILCADGGHSDWSSPYLFYSPACDDFCNFKFEMTCLDYYGWPSDSITITQNGVEIATLGNFIVAPGAYKTFEVPLCPDIPFEVFWNFSGSSPYYYDKGLNIYTPSMEEIFHMERGTLSPGTIIFSGQAACDPTCLKPKNLTTSAIGMDTVTLGWDEMGTATQWEIIVLPKGEPIPADATGIIADTNPYVLTEGIEPGKEYDYYVRAICDTNETSLWSRPFSFTTEMCTSTCDYTFTMSSTMPEAGKEGWTPAIMKIIQNEIVVAEIVQPLFSNDNADTVVTVQLCSGIPFIIHWFDPSEPWNYTGTDYATYVGLTVVNNFNGDMIFEMIPQSGIIQPNTDIYTDIPFCEVISCPQPTNLIVTDNTENSKTLSWTPGGGETEWEVIVQTAGGAFPIGNVAITATVNSPTYTAENLENGVFYEYFVRAVCNDSDKSFWSASQPFNAFTPPGFSIAIMDTNNPEGGAITDNTELMVCPEDNCVQLSASYTTLGDTTTYQVESIPYVPPYQFTGGTPISFGPDAANRYYFSPVMDLTFDFCFFGETFSAITVSPMGTITFDIARSGEMTPWFINDEIPNANFNIKNAIYGVYQSLTLSTVNDFANANINYQIHGTYPNRAFVVNFFEVATSPGCDSDPSIGAQTSQMVMYESTNIIEVYADRIVPCGSSYLNKAVLGIQNAAGTEAFAPEGRNTGHWSTSKEAWRFVPAGASTATFEWLKNDVVIGTSTDIEVCATELTAMKARATYTNCNGDQIVKESNVKISVYDEIITGEPEDLTLCPNGMVTFDLNKSLNGIVENTQEYTFTFYGTEEAALAGGDDNLDVSYTTDTEQTIYVRIVESNKPCFIVKSFELLFVNMPPEFTLTDNRTICAGTDTTLTVTPVGFEVTDATYTWKRDDIVLSDTTSSIIATIGGEYEVTVNKDGCIDTKKVTVTILPLPELDSVEDTTVCNSYIVPALTKGTYYTGSQGTGTELKAGDILNTTQVIYLFAQTGTEPNCTDEKSFTVTVVPTPKIDIAKGCDGVDYILEGIFIDDIYNQDNAVFVWTDSENTVLGTDQKLMITKVGKYTLTVLPINDDCPTEVSIDVTETGCEIPRGISPNNDGKNDEFDLSGLNVKKISIFNRYGKEVYTKVNYSKEWKGQANNGNDLPTGTYFYMIDREGGESTTGWVYINRDE